MTSRWIFYDTETTGVKPGSDRIIEIAAFDPIRQETFVRLIHPECPIPAEATAIHHITDEMVSQEPSIREILPLFIEFCGPDAVLVAHNNDAFDFPFLHAEASRANCALPSWKTVDSLKWARKYRSDLPRHSLQFLRQIYGIPENQAHRALDDVLVLYRIFSLMTDDLTVETVLRLMQEVTPVTTMPFGKHQGKPLQEIPKEYVSWLDKQGVFEKMENQQLKTALQQLNMLS